MGHMFFFLNNFAVHTHFEERFAIENKSNESVI